MTDIPFHKLHYHKLHYVGDYTMGSSPFKQESLFNNLVDGADDPESSRCLTCGATDSYQAPGKGPHYAALHCSRCHRFIRWLPKPRQGD